MTLPIGSPAPDWTPGRSETPEALPSQSLHTEGASLTSLLQWSTNYSMQRNSGERRSLLKQMAEPCIHSFWCSWSGVGLRLLVRRPPFFGPLLWLLGCHRTHMPYEHKDGPALLPDHWKTVPWKKNFSEGTFSWVLDPLPVTSAGVTTETSEWMS